MRSLLIVLDKINDMISYMLTVFNCKCVEKAGI